MVKGDNVKKIIKRKKILRCLPGSYLCCLVKQIGQLFGLFLTCSQAKKKPPSWEAKFEKNMNYFRYQ